MTAPFRVEVASHVESILEARTHACLHDPSRNLVALLAGGGDVVRDRTATQIAEDVLRVVPAPRGLDGLAELVRRIHDAVAAFPTEDDLDDLWSWGVSVALVSIDGELARIAHAGSVRCYLVRHRNVARLGLDDTLGDRLVGWSNETESETLRTVIVQVPGARPFDRVDLAEQRVRTGDRILLASRDAVDPIERGSVDLEAAPATLPRAILADSDAPVRSCAVIAFEQVETGPYR